MVDERPAGADIGGQETPQPSYPGATAPPPGQEQRTSGLAIWSLVTAFLCAPVGVILGIIALVQINKDPQRLRGRGLAIAGTVIGGVVTVMLPIVAMLAAIAIPSLSTARDKARESACMANMKQLCIGMNLYMDDHQGYLPPAGRWNDELRPYVSGESAFLCPSEGSEEPSYAMNAQLSGVDVGWVLSPETVMLFDSVPGRNKAGGPELLPQPARHGYGQTIGFVDGHVDTADESGVGELNWNPSWSPGPSDVPLPEDEGWSFE